MSKTIYLDTNVYMDFLLDRNSSAYDLLMRTLDCEFFIICSDLVVEELQNNNILEDSSLLIRTFLQCKKMKFVNVDVLDKNEAKQILSNHSTHYVDALHKVLAKKHGAEIFVTRNIKDFMCFDDILIKHTDII